MLNARQDRTMEQGLFLFVALICLCNSWLAHEWSPYEFLRHGGDELGYYQWLPASIIEGDVDEMYWAYGLENGRSLSLFTFGVALLQLPFFLLGHASAYFFDYPLTGFSAPYAVWQLFGMACYAGAGCVLAFRLAARFSDRWTALLAVLVLFATSNLYYYCVHQPNMSHLYSFFLVGLFMHCFFRLMDAPPVAGARPWHAMLFVFSGALLVLVRQLNAVVFLVPLVLVLRSPGGIKGFLRVLFKHRAYTIMALVFALVPWVLQSVYWHHITGEWFTFTYGKKGEGFEFDKMVPGMLLMSVRNGWWTYSPIMLPVCITLLVHAWRSTLPARAIALLLVITWLLYSAWWCWWLGGSFGIRAMVDLYALLAIPLAWMIRSIQRRSLLTRLVATIVLVFLIKLNIGLSERYRWEWSGMEWTWQDYFEQVSGVLTGK